MKRRHLLAALLITVIPAAYSQEADTEPQAETVKHGGYRLVFMRTDARSDSLLRVVRPQESASVPVPKFIIKSENNNFLMTIGGAINPILGWDIGNNLYDQPDAGINFVTQDIPVPAVKGHKSDFFINALNADVDLTIVGLANTPHAITGYIKFGTNGVNNQIKLKKAYITWRGLTAGLVSTLFKDGLACQPPTIDPQGPSGCVSGSVYEIGYKSKSFSGFRFAAAVDLPTFHSSNGVYRGKDFPVFDGTQVTDFSDVQQMIPDIPVWVEWAENDANRIRLSGIFRDFAYHDELADRTRHSVGWGLMLSGNWTPVKPLQVYLQAVYGKGIGNYIQDISGLPLSFIPKNSTPGYMTPAPMTGLNLGFSIQATKRLQFNIMASEARIWNVEEYANALDETQNYKYALYGAVNAFYNITPYLQWGVECVWGKRQTWNIGGAHDTRIQTQLSFSL